MLTFQHIIDFARSQKEEIVNAINDVIYWEEDDVTLTVAILIENSRLKLVNAIEVDITDMYTAFVKLFDIDIDKNTRKCTQLDLLQLVENELNKFESRINAFTD